MPKLLKYEGFTNGYEYLESSENDFKGRGIDIR